MLSAVMLKCCHGWDMKPVPWICCDNWIYSVLGVSVKGKWQVTVCFCSSSGMDAEMEVINVYCLLSFGHWQAVIHVHDIFYPLFAMQSFTLQINRIPKKTWTLNTGRWMRYFHWKDICKIRIQKSSIDLLKKQLTITTSLVLTYFQVYNILC